MAGLVSCLPYPGEQRLTFSR